MQTGCLYFAKIIKVTHLCDTKIFFRFIVRKVESFKEMTRNRLLMTQVVGLLDTKKGADI